MIPACSHVGTPRHFHSSTTSGSAFLMIVRTRAMVSPRQSSSSLILSSIRDGAAAPLPGFGLLLALFMIVVAFVKVLARARGGIRTLMPRRAGGFKPPASAIAPPGPPAPTVRDGTSGSARRLRGCDGCQQCGSHVERGVVTEVVRDDDTFDHVGEDVGGCAAADADRHDRAAREPTQRTRGAGAARWCSECGNDQSGSPGRGAEPACHVG